MRRRRSGAHGYLGETLEEIGAGSDLEVSIEYGVTLGEPMVMYDRNGDGYPGSPPEVELLGVTVDYWMTSFEERKRDDHWIWNELDRIATQIIEPKWEEVYEDRCLEDASDQYDERDRC